MIAPEIPAPRIAARTRGLTKVYGQGDARVVALDHVDVDFSGGRFTAVMGPSGSGKSTLMHCVAGLDRPTSGDVLIGETTISTLRDAKLTALRRDRIGFIFQAFNLVPTLTARENIELPMAIAGRRPDRDWFDQVITAVGLADRLAHKPSQLSGGQQQRVACARALVSKPDIIFADEPTGNLDSRSSAEVLAFLARSVADLGQTIVMVTHDPVAAAHADRALFLADGRIVGDLPDPTRESVLDYMARLSPDDELADADTTEIPAITNPIKAPIPSPAASAGDGIGRRIPASAGTASCRTGDRSGTRVPAGRTVPAMRPVEHMRPAPASAPAASAARPAVRPPAPRPAPAASSSVAPSVPAARMPAPAPPMTRRMTSSPKPVTRPVRHPADPTYPTSPDTARSVIRREPVVPRPAPTAPVSGSIPPRPASAGVAPISSVSTTGSAGSAPRPEHASGTGGAARSAVARNGAALNGSGPDGSGMRGARPTSGAGPTDGVEPARGGASGAGAIGTTAPAAERSCFPNPFAPMTRPAAAPMSRPGAVPTGGAVPPLATSPAPPPTGRPGDIPPSRSEAVPRRRPENGPVDGNRGLDGHGAPGTARSNPFAPGAAAPARTGPFTAGLGAGGPLARRAATGASATSSPASTRPAVDAPTTPGPAGAGGPSPAVPTVDGRSRTAPPVRIPEGSGAGLRPIVPAPLPGAGARITVDGHHAGTGAPFPGTPASTPGTAARGPVDGSARRQDASAPGRAAPLRRVDPVVPPPLRGAPPVVPVFPPHVPTAPPHVPPFTPAVHSGVPPAPQSRRTEPSPAAGAPGAPPSPPTQGRTGRPSPVPAMWAEPDEPAPDRATAFPARAPVTPAVDGADAGSEQVYDAPVQLPRTRPARSMPDERPARYRPARRA